MKKVTKVKVPPWGNEKLPYYKRANWSAIADAIFAEDAVAPKSWAIDDLETRCFMQTRFNFDCDLHPQLWSYIFKRLEVLIVLKPPAEVKAVPTKVEKFAAAACGEARP